MNRMPGFTAEAALGRSSNHYRNGPTVSVDVDSVVPQDCGFFKNVGCVLGPFSWCALAGLGGAEPFWNCVDQASGGSCLECIGTTDPREKDMGGTPDDYVGGSYNSGTGFQGGGSYGQGLSVEGVTGLSAQQQRQLNRIERCACGPLVRARLPINAIANALQQPPAPVRRAR